MRITPLEIRQHTFDKSFRGYDTESVDAFLLSLSQEWERVSEDLRSSKHQLEIAEKEIVRMKEIENTLFKTLKAAEDTQQHINAKAEAEASLITDKARQNAEEVLTEAHKKADMLISESENKAKFLVEEAVNDLKNYERDFKAMERYKDYLVIELKSFANDALNKVTKFEERINSRTNESRLNELEIKGTEKVAIPTLESVKNTQDLFTQKMLPKIDREIENPTVSDGLLKPVEDQERDFMMQFPSDDQINSPLIAEETPASTNSNVTEIEFNPANDFDDEDEELPTAYSLDYTKPTTEFVQGVFNETADNLMKEMKATRGRPRKAATNDSSLPTVSSVMGEFAKENPATISNGGGSFFDDI